jgi:outer membrane lipoprotein-sorting protein
VRVFSKFTALFLGMVLVAPMASASPENPANLTELVDAVEATYGGATSIRAEFVQVDKSASLGTEVRQRGRIAIERPRNMP